MSDTKENSNTKSENKTITSSSNYEQYKKEIEILLNNFIV
jgi:hypothetical protein